MSAMLHSIISVLPNGDIQGEDDRLAVIVAALDNISATEWRPLPAEGDGTVSLLHSIISVLPNGDLFISSTRTPASSCTR